MELETYEDIIVAAKAVLKIIDREFVRLSAEQSESVINQIEDRFVNGHNWCWWWEHLHRMDFAAFHIEDRGFVWLHQILPEPEANVWFVVEPFGDSKQFSIYEARAKHIQPVIEESIFFEYYMVAKDLSWLLVENHHGCFCCVGEPITTRLQKIVEQNPNQWRKASRSE